MSIDKESIAQSIRQSYSISYSYDALYRLHQVTYPIMPQSGLSNQTHIFDYDDIGNRTKWQIIYNSIVLREYEGVELRLRAQWSGGLSQASYVWSKARGNQDYSIWPGVSPEYDFPALATNRWGYMSTDTRHAFKANGFFRLPLAFEIAYGITYVSGYAWTVQRNVLPYGTEYPEGRGSRRLPDFSQLDLDFSRTFRIRGTELRLIASVLNVFDREAVTAVNPLEESAGEPIDYQRPRRFEVGLRYAF